MKTKENARLLKTKFWTDAYICALPPDGKLLYLYLLSAPATNVSGTYEISIRQMAFDSGLPDTVCIQYMSRFQADSRLLYVDGWVTIRNFGRHQNWTSETIQKCIKNQIELAPDSHKAYIRHGYSIDTPTIPHPPKEVEVEVEVEVEREVEKEVEVEVEVHKNGPSPRLDKSGETSQQKKERYEHNQQLIKKLAADLAAKKTLNAKKNN